MIVVYIILGVLVGLPILYMLVVNFVHTILDIYDEVTK